jgi:hypothetical protein
MLSQHERIIKQYKVARLLLKYRNINIFLVQEILSNFRDNTGNAIIYNGTIHPSENSENFALIYDALKNVSDDVLEHLSKL